MARRMPPRYKSGPKKGQFMSRGSRRRRRNPGKAASKPRRSRGPRPILIAENPGRRRRRRRRNPGMPTIVRQLTGGLKDAAAIVGGEAVARIIPTVAKLPKEGAIGLGVQAASAVAAGYVAHKALGRDVARMVLAGGLSAPLKTALVAANIPFLSPALSPKTQAQNLGAYKGLRAYVQPTNGVGRYVTAGGMGAYVQPRDRAGVGSLDLSLQ